MDDQLNEDEQNSDGLSGSDGICTGFVPADKEIDERAIEIVVGFFIRKMTYSFDRYQADIAKIAAHRFGRPKLDSAVFRSPDD